MKLQKLQNNCIQMNQIEKQTIIKQIYQKEDRYLHRKENNFLMN